ncbi:DNA helicase, partial [Corchorus olitorius]
TSFAYYTWWNKIDIINASICTSHLWKEFEIFTLVTNMRLLRPGIDDLTRRELHSFADWLLQVGDGTVQSFPQRKDEECQWIQIPEELLIHPRNNPSESIFQAVYRDFEGNFAEPIYLRERAIVTPYNETAAELNEYILQNIPGDYVTYYSSNILSRSSDVPNQDIASYPSESLNKISVPGVPDHELRLKIGCVVMLMRNINQVAGLCNGTRLVILQLTTFLIEARIVSGDHLGDKVYIPRIIFSVKETRFPFVLNRKQFPLKLSYAMTINKSQGQTLKYVGIYLPRPVFSLGQLYVTLERATSHRNLKLLMLDENGAATSITKNVVYKEIFEYIFQR